MVIGKRTYILIYFLCSPIFGWAIQSQPWIGQYFEFEDRNSLASQTYPYIDQAGRLKKYSSNDLFLTAGLANAIQPELSLEAEMAFFHPSRRRARIDCIRFAVRYALLDDLLGDPIALTLTGIFTEAFKESLRDVSLFHHGKHEFELWACFGKDKGEGEKWRWRLWANIGMGIAEIGSPWLQGRVVYQYRLCPMQDIQLFAFALKGIGRDRIDLDRFYGYGSLNHQSLDLGIRYTRLIPFFGSVQFEYAKRVYAYNFPARAHRFLIEIFYSFGL